MATASGINDPERESLRAELKRPEAVAICLEERVRAMERILP